MSVVLPDDSTVVFVLFTQTSREAALCTPQTKYHVPFETVLLEATTAFVVLPPAVNLTVPPVKKDKP